VLISVHPPQLGVRFLQLVHCTEVVCLLESPFREVSLTLNTVVISQLVSQASLPPTAALDVFQHVKVMQ
jgi:hypothetical protein